MLTQRRATPQKPVAIFESSGYHCTDIYGMCGCTAQQAADNALSAATSCCDAHTA
jgi:hypothetical protein